MRLAGLHHITMITADAQANADFYAERLGLRMVKKTVNFDRPDAYHLYFGDERGSPGSILTWFEFPGAAAGRAGAGMVHRIELAVAGAAALDFWAGRLEAAGVAVARAEGRLDFADPDGLALALVAAGDGDPPLRAEHPEIPAEHAIAGVHAARAYASFARVRDGVLADVLGFEALGGGEYRLDGSERRFAYGIDPAPDRPGHLGAGTVHHIAWASADADHERWQARVREAGGSVTDVRDRDYFRAIYFREPRGVLFEIATLSPGFATDEDPGHLGEALRLPHMHEHLREELERSLRPVVNPRARRRAAASS
jgi:glyoxalase family protein